MTLIGMPAAIVSSIACRPATVAGILMKRFGRSTSFVQADGLGLRLLGVVREVRVDLERDPAVLALALVPDGAQDVARGADVVLGELPEDLLGIVELGAQLPDLVVIGVALGDRALEDRGVGRHAHDALFDQALEVAVLDELARQVVDPDALIALGELLQGSHVAGPFKGGPYTVTLPMRGLELTR